MCELKDVTKYTYIVVLAEEKKCVYEFIFFVFRMCIWNESKINGQRKEES